MNLTSDTVSVILLAHNEADTIEAEINLFYDKIISKLPGSQLIVSEDGSTDKTAEILQRLSQELGLVHLHGEKRKGYKQALLDALREARHNYIFLSDTGQKHDPDDFWRLWKHRNACDIIVGRRTGRKDHLSRRLFTKIYNMIVRMYFEIDSLCDSDCGFRLFNRKVADKIFQEELLFKELVNSEIAIRAVLGGLKYLEAPISYKQRQGSSRTFTFRQTPKIIINVLKDLRRLKRFGIKSSVPVYYRAQLQ